jgi:antitoxin (DNA-binding transcriptional repressor) of toxin-antitoxin stability system
MVDRRMDGPTEFAEVATSSYLLSMKVVGIKELKNKLSEYVKLAKSGEVVLVTDRGDVVAELRAPTPWNDPMMDDPWWAEQVRKGIITPAKIPPGTPFVLERNYPLIPFEQLMREHYEDREDRE